mmetsp:Transcript_37851/g.45717  ORF Transcript_37851/g.45717 Transcript_37851/m.45717 type:complete len:220 (-) Transcript_37851:438-1097(-)
MNWLKDTRSTFPNRCRRQHPQTSHQHTGLVTQNISKNIPTNNSIELLGITNKLHGTIIYIHMFQLHVGELLRTNLNHHFLPKLTHIQHVGLIDAHEFSLAFGCHISRHTCDTFDFILVINHVVVSYTFSSFGIGINTLGFSKINISGEFADYHDIDSFNHLAFECGGVDKLRDYFCRAKVGKQTHFLSHFQESTFGTKFTGVVVPLVTTNTRQQDRITR